jgi:hypothetical protein
MLRCAAFFVVAASPKVRFTPQDLRALPANFLQSRPKIDFLREHQSFTFGLSNGSVFFSSHSQQHNAAHERDSSDDRWKRKRFGFLRRHFQWTDIHDIFFGRIGDPLIREGHDSYSNQYDGKK